MKKLFYLLAITFSCSSFGQNLIPNYEIGCYFDFNKQLINGYYDFDYEPEKSLDVSYVIEDNLTDGYYINSDGIKKTGFLKFNNPGYDLTFKSNKDDKNKEIIKVENCKNFVIGIDTMFVVPKNEFIGENFSKNVFVKFFEKVDGLKFFIYKHLQGNGYSPNRYFVQKANESGNIIFPTNANKFKKMAAEIFASDSFLKKAIEQGKFKEKDIPSMIKIYKYRQLFTKNAKIYFNSSWDETNSPKESSYYAKIESVKDSIFHLSYFFNNDVKIYEGDFTSFYPHKKRGVFVFYYPNGKIRKKVKYVDNKPKSAIEYFINGEIHRAYAIQEGEELNYAVVNNEQGESIYENDNKTGKESFNDVITGKEITYEYKDQKLKNVYYTDMNGEKVYQLCEKNAKLETKDLQKLINDKLKYPTESVQKYNHGIALIKCIVEPTGLVSEAKLIKGFGTDCDIAINDFLLQFKSQITWKAGKVNGVNVRQEIIIPLDFSINGFSTYKNNYNNSWMLSHLMMQQMMMQQQMMIPMGRF